MLASLNVSHDPRQAEPNLPEINFCEHKTRLLDAFLGAVHELNAVQEQQTKAVIEGDTDFGRFDILLHDAMEKKDRAKYAWIAHVEEHGCHEGGID